MPQDSSRRRSRRMRLLASASAATLIAVCHGGRAAAKNLYYIHPGGGDWNTSSDVYFGWHYDASGNFLFADFPSGGDSALIAQSGTNGVANAIVNFNTSISGANAIGDLLIDSNNLL